MKWEPVLPQVKTRLAKDIANQLDGCMSPDLRMSPGDRLDLLSSRVIEDAKLHADDMAVILKAVRVAVQQLLGDAEISEWENALVSLSVRPGHKRVSYKASEIDRLIVERPELRTTLMAMRSTSAVKPSVQIKLK